MIMTLEEKDRMWQIDSHLQIGNKVSEEDKKWFNDNFDEMKMSVEEDFNHWHHHTSKIPH